MEEQKKYLVALLTNNDDDVYCFRKELIEGLIDEGYSLLISCPNGPKFDLLTEIEYKYDDPIIDRRGTNIVNDFKLLIHYRKLFKKTKPDIILTYTAKPGVYGSIAAYSLGIPYINNITGLGSVLNKRGFMRKFIMRLFKFAYSKADCIMFQNETNMELAKKLGWVKANSRLIPGSGVALERFSLQDYPVGGNGIEGEDVVFNYVGRIMHDKGVDDYIEAAKIIKKKYPKTQFNMLGFVEPTESKYYEILNDLEKQDIVKYYGSQQDVRPFIKRSHAIIHPSTYGEGMSNVLLESAACGRVIITTDNPGCRETVDNEKSGFVYHGGSVDELVDVIIRFLETNNEKRKEMGLCGNKKMKEEFSRDIVVKNYIEEIARVINK